MALLRSPCFLKSNQTDIILLPAAIQSTLLCRWHNFVIPDQNLREDLKLVDLCRIPSMNSESRPETPMVGVTLPKSFCLSQGQAVPIFVCLVKSETHMNSVWNGMKTINLDNTLVYKTNLQELQPLQNRRREKLRQRSYSAKECRGW